MVAEDHNVSFTLVYYEMEKKPFFSWYVLSVFSSQRLQLFAVKPILEFKAAN